ncbi:unnamed protein product [Sphagnum compactum]
MKNVCLVSSVYFSDSTCCKASCSKWDHINSEQKTRSLCLCNACSKWDHFNSKQKARNQRQ